MERIDCVADPFALLRGLVLAHVVGSSRALAVLGSLLAVGARLPALPRFAMPAPPVHARWRTFAAPRAVAAAA